MAPEGSKNEPGHLDQPLPAHLAVTVAEYFLSLDAVDFVVVVPGDLRVGRNVSGRVEGEPRKPQVVTIHEHVLCVTVRIAAVIDEAFGFEKVD